MIEKIEVKDCACFDEEGITFQDLSKINLIYGSNATGKTTISRIIANDADIYQKCNILWSDSKREIYVYNSDFIEKNFNKANGSLEGIFSLGEEAKEVDINIEDLNEKRNKLKEKYIRLENTYNDLEKKLEGLETDFENYCWDNFKNVYDDYFQKTFEGVRNSKSKFKNKVINKYNDFENLSEVKNIEELKNTAEKVYDEDIDNIEELKSLEYGDLKEIEEDTLLETGIISKTDSEFSSMINSLGNSDWIREGREYLKENDDICPFCQQDINEHIRDQIINYFDEAYETELEKIKNMKSLYIEITGLILDDLNNLISKSSEIKYIEEDKLSNIRRVIKAKVKSNLNVFEKKLNKPSEKLNIDPVYKDIEKINELVKKTNEKIIEHNDLVDNLEKRRQEHDEEIWKYIVKSAKKRIESYKTDKSSYNKGIRNIDNKKQILKQEMEIAQNKIEKLEEKRKSIRPVINEINKILEKYGFKNFKLAESEIKESHYKIIRHNGEDAISSLSEGERTFISFLYFYYKIEEVLEEQEIFPDNRIIVIDDPVSSLDSDILFIVSCLIKEIIRKSREESKIKQIFVFTHNVYFYRELSQIKRRNYDIKYYVIRKNEGITNKCTEYDKNPIKSSYKLLWEKVQEYHESPEKLIPNILRRILEYYFEILGVHGNLMELTKKFDGENKKIFKDLIFWCHQGSHAIHDDLFVARDNNKKYLDIFEEIFKETDHYEHYKMMMDID